jgi:hypothetical protein
MKRYVKMPLKHALPLLFIGALVLAVSISGCTSPATSPSPSASSVPTATPIATATPTVTPTATPTPSPSPSPAQTSTKSGSVGATLTQGGLTATFGNYGPVSYTQIDGGVPSKNYWLGNFTISGTAYYNPANPPARGFLWSDGDNTSSHFDLGLPSSEQTLGTHAVQASYQRWGGNPSTSSAYPTKFELIVPGSPGSGITYTFIWTLTGT